MLHLCLTSFIKCMKAFNIHTHTQKMNMWVISTLFESRLWIKELFEQRHSFTPVIPLTVQEYCPPPSQCSAVMEINLHGKRAPTWGKSSCKCGQVSSWGFTEATAADLWSHDSLTESLWSFYFFSISCHTHINCWVVSFHWQTWWTNAAPT